MLVGNQQKELKKADAVTKWLHDAIMWTLRNFKVVHLENLVFLKNLFLIIFPATERNKYSGTSLLLYFSNSSKFSGPVKTPIRSLLQEPLRKPPYFEPIIWYRGNKYLSNLNVLDFYSKFRCKFMQFGEVQDNAINDNYDPFDDLETAVETLNDKRPNIVPEGVDLLLHSKTMFQNETCKCIWNTFETLELLGNG